MRSNSCRRCRFWRPALTLIEVVAGIGLLGTILVAMLLAEARFTRQSRAAKDRLAACRAAETLLEGWWAEPEALPRNASGRLAEGDGFLWWTYVCRNEAVEKLDGQVVRLEVRPDRPSADEKAMVTVDVVLPRQEDQKAAGVHAD